MYVNAVAEIADMSTVRLAQGECSLLGDWLAAYLSFSHSQETARLLAALGKLVTRARLLVRDLPSRLQMTRDQSLAGSHLNQYEVS
jgi:hypothetical protein